MHQVTHISYGEGTVNIVLDSSSQTEVVAPDIRFGDYSNVVTSCFTQKELDRISEGETAFLTFYFVVSDEAENELLEQQYSNAIEANEEVYGNLTEGIYVDFKASKAISDDKATDIVNFSSDVDVQMDIPLYLVREDRSYFYLSSRMGECELYEDASPDAEVLTVSTDALGSGVILYQDIGESLIEKDENLFKIKSQHLFLAGVVVLVILWFAIDHMHKNNRSE